MEIPDFVPNKRREDNLSKSRSRRCARTASLSSSSGSSGSESSDDGKEPACEKLNDVCSGLEKNLKLDAKSVHFADKDKDKSEDDEDEPSNGESVPEQKPPSKRVARSAREEEDGDSDTDLLGHVGEQEREMFYDPGMDDQDEDFVNARRSRHLPKQASKKPGMSENTILSCPKCFSIVCVDCQPHDRNPNQFRAMFVQNCAVDRGEEAPAPGPRRSWAKAAGDLPVRCKTCQAELGVMDPDEVFHLLYALPSDG